MTWSDEQNAIFDWFRNQSGNLVVTARAGTGKTTTIKEAFNHAPESRMLYAVFNKRNQREAEGAIRDERVEVRTLHSLGFRFIKSVWQDAKPDETNQIEFDRVRHFVDIRERELIAAVVKLVGFAKNLFIKPTLDELIALADDKDISCECEPKIMAEVAQAAMELSKTPDTECRISFNDMVWLPVACQWVRPSFDLVCIDEAQDMNLPQLVMARGSCRTAGRVVVVGDDRQAIYGFRGAASNGMRMMKFTLRAQELPLTVTRRCPKRVVNMAKALVPDYRAADDAPDGEVTPVSQFKLMEAIKVGDAILSRLNAPLMPLALQLLRRNVPARIEGKDIGKQLAGIVRQMKASSVPQFIQKLETWADKQRTRAAKTKNPEKKLEEINDIYAALLAVAEASSSVSDIENRLTTLFSDSDTSSANAVTLSSVHKAKGLEWHRVFILSETFRRRDSDSTAGTRSSTEEDNIYYVALTRTKHTLFLVGGTHPAGENPSSPQQIASSSSDGVDFKSCAADEKISTRDEFDDAPLPGMVALRVGDVMSIDGSEMTCDFVNSCRARFERGGKTVSISPHVEPKLIVRRGEAVTA